MVWMSGEKVKNPVVYRILYSKHTTLKDTNFSFCFNGEGLETITETTAFGLGIECKYRGIELNPKEINASLPTVITDLYGEKSSKISIEEFILFERGYSIPAD